MKTGVGTGGNPDVIRPAEHHLWPQERAVAQERERCLRIALEHARSDKWSCDCGLWCGDALGWRDHLAEKMAR